jgi:hypothetical protein
MSLTDKQTRRFDYCLGKMGRNYPVNPMDIKARTVAADQNVEAARCLREACEASTDRWGAEEVNRAIREAEEHLELKSIEGGSE